MSAYAQAALLERDFAPNVGGGVDRDKLDKSDFVYPEDRSFPVVKPGDVSDAVSSFGRSSHKDDFEGFKKRLIALCKRKGDAFMKALPKEWKQDMNMESEQPQATRASVLIEALDLSEAHIDAQARTVRQVLIRAGESKNRRMYAAEVLQKAQPLFEGVKTYANHPGRDDSKNRPERSIREITGWVSDVQFENGALVGTRHFTMTEAGKDSWSLVEQIVTGKAPASLMGASINAVGRGRTEKTDNGEILVVESIEGVTSVDDVTTPAAGGGFERLVASNGDEMTQQLLAALDYKEWLEARPEFVEKLKREYKAVRLDDETKARLAESDEKVKAVEDALAEQQTEFQTMQAAFDTLSGTYQKLISEHRELSLKMSVYEALGDTPLPAVYRADLLETLPKLPTGEWKGRIETELKKLKRSDARPKVNVTGAGVQIAEAVDMGADRVPYPRSGEDVNAWMERMKAIGR